MLVVHCQLLALFETIDFWRCLIVSRARGQDSEKLYEKQEAHHKNHHEKVPCNVQRFRGGLVFKAHRLCVSLNSRLESNK